MKTTPVSHGEITIALQCPDEEQQKRLVHDELTKQLQTLLLPHLWVVEGSSEQVTMSHGKKKQINETEATTMELQIKSKVTDSS